MMMKTVRITKSLVIEIRTFCMPPFQQAPYQLLLGSCAAQKPDKKSRFNAKCMSTGYFREEDNGSLGNRL
jgi:hypothetical protein